MFKRTTFITSTCSGLHNWDSPWHVPRDESSQFLSYTNSKEEVPFEQLITNTVWKWLPTKCFNECYNLNLFNLSAISSWLLLLYLTTSISGPFTLCGDLGTFIGWPISKERKKISSENWICSNYIHLISEHYFLSFSLISPWDLYQCLNAFSTCHRFVNYKFWWDEGSEK